jgi:hypothetical protein
LRTNILKERPVNCIGGERDADKLALVRERLTKDCRPSSIGGEQLNSASRRIVPGAYFADGRSEGHFDKAGKTDGSLAAAAWFRSAQNIVSRFGIADVAESGQIKDKWSATKVLKKVRPEI